MSTEFDSELIQIQDSLFRLELERAKLTGKIDSGVAIGKDYLPVSRLSFNLSASDLLEELIDHVPACSFRDTLIRVQESQRRSIVDGLAKGVFPPSQATQANELLTQLAFGALEEEHKITRYELITWLMRDEVERTKADCCIAVVAGKIGGADNLPEGVNAVFGELEQAKSAGVDSSKLVSAAISFCFTKAHTRVLFARMFDEGSISFGESSAMILGANETEGLLSNLLLPAAPPWAKGALN